MIWIIIIILILFLLIFILNYRIKYDTLVCFTGGLGSGKSLLSVKTFLSLLKKVRFQTKIKNLKIWLENIFKSKKNKKNFLPRPMGYSNIPLRISKKEMAIVLKPEHLLLMEKLGYRSVIFIDELGAFASQFDYSNPFIKDNFDEFVRLYRHYTLGGYIVVNDQCSENIVLQIRRRINTVFNLMHFKKHLFGLFFTVKIRNISISEEIKTIEQKDTEDNMTLYFGFFPLKNTYDTYCYSERYSTVKKCEEKCYNFLKKNKLFICPNSKTSLMKRKGTTDDESFLVPFSKKKKRLFFRKKE